MGSYIRGSIRDWLMHYSRNNVLSFDKIGALKILDRLSEAELTILAKQEALEMARYAADHSPYYMKRYRGKDLLGAFDEVYYSLPVINKTDIRGKEKSIATRPLRFLKKSATSGTSGVPLTVYRSPLSILNEYTYVWYYRMSHGLKKGDPIVSLRAPLKPGQLFHYNKLENILYFSPYLLSIGHIDKFIEQLSRFKPKAMLTYPSYLCNLVHLLGQKNYKIDIPLIFTSSETLHIYQRAKIESYFNCRIFDWYGTVERTIAIGECDFGNYHEMPMYSFNEYTPNGVISASFINKAYPLVRYSVEDRIVKLDETCKCGKGHIIKSIDGRVSDSLVLHDGVYISGGSLGFAFNNVGSINLAQVVQRTSDQIDVNVVPDKNFSKEDEARVINSLKQRLPENVIIKFNRIEEDGIIRSKSGKFQFVVSDFGK